MLLGALQDNSAAANLLRRAGAAVRDRLVHADIVGPGQPDPGDDIGVGAQPLDDLAGFERAGRLEGEQHMAAVGEGGELLGNGKVCWSLLFFR